MATLRSAIETAILGTLDRSDLSSYAGAWFTMAHQEVQKLANFRCAQTSTSKDMTAGTNYVVAPTDLRQPEFLAELDGTGAVVDFITITGIKEVFKARYDETYSTSEAESTQKLGAFWGDNLELWPTPDDSTHDVKIYYYKFLTVPATNASDWFTDNAYDYLHHQALVYSAPFLGADERIATWQTLADAARARLLALAAAQVTFGPLQMRG